VNTLLATGCADTRISFEELRMMEHKLASVAPVEIDPAELALTDVLPYTIKTGDILSLNMIGLMEPYSQTAIQARVHDDGRIRLPLVGEVEVAGLRLEGVEQAVYEAHVPKYVKALTVYAELVVPEPTTVFVVGAAGQPGLVALQGNQRNILYALALSAGFSPTASGKVHVRPIRPERGELTYDLANVNDLRRALVAPPLESGDMVIVEPAELSAVYVTGLVNVPGPIPMPQNGKLSLVRTIAAAGGLRDFLDPQEATLWRTLSNGEQVRVKIELAGVLTGELPDVNLFPGDVLQVPHTASTRFREWALANIRIGPFGVTAVYDPVADYRARVLRGDYRDDDFLRRSLLLNVGTGAAELLIPPVQPPPAP
jgi:polysaccharide export outer membrane protein